MIRIEKNYVSSSNVEAIGYDNDTQILRVWFLNGSVYDYYNVSFDVYNSLMGASSIGSFLNNRVKGNYRYSKVG